MSAQPEALRLADWLQAAVQTYPQMSEDEPGGYATEVDQVMDEAAAALRRLHAEIEHLKGNSLAAAFGIEQGTLNHMTGMAERLAAADALLRQALEALEADDWQKKLQAAIDIKRHLENGS